MMRDALSSHYVRLAGFYHKEAARQSPEGKIRYNEAAELTSNFAIRVTEDAQKATAAARAVRDLTNCVSKLTINAKSLAAIGDNKAAKAVMSDLQVALEGCEKSHGDAIIARESAQRMMAKFHNKKFNELQENEDQENEDQEDDPPTPQPKESDEATDAPGVD